MMNQYAPLATALNNGAPQPVNQFGGGMISPPIMPGSEEEPPIASESPLAGYSYNPMTGGDMRGGINMIDPLHSIYEQTLGPQAATMLDPVGSIVGNMTGGSSSPTVKVICTELHRQGFLDDATYAADQVFGAVLALSDPDAMRGYHMWAPALVSAMKASPALSKMVAVIATPWAREMAYRMGAREAGSVIGWVQMEVGLIVCRAIGRCVSSLAEA